MIENDVKELLTMFGNQFTKESIRESLLAFEGDKNEVINSFKFKLQQIEQKGRNVKAELKQQFEEKKKADEQKKKEVELSKELNKKMSVREELKVEKIDISLWNKAYPEQSYVNDS